VLHQHWIPHGDASVTTIAAKLVIERLRRAHDSGRRFPADAPVPRFRQKSRLDLNSDVCKAGRPIEFTTPEQLGALAVFLCSDAASQLNGVPLPVDGGWLAR
jgi:NAD(P)-dependent dehydrogenase (short-subunit alcohol dehydrogenase family)